MPYEGESTHTHMYMESVHTHSSLPRADCALPQGSIQGQAGEIKEAQVLRRHQLAELVTAESK